MKRPRICAVITEDDPQAAKSVAGLVDLFEVRIDLIGEGWQRWVKKLGKPWIACNRSSSEGGKWEGGEAGRIAALVQAVRLGASIVDVELSTGDLASVVGQVKNKKVKCLLSHHNLVETPPPADLEAVIEAELAAGADICKVVTTAQRFEDNLAVLHLFSAFPGKRLVAFAMGPLGVTSRVLAPLAGGYFTYASIDAGKESAPGQLTVTDLRKIYESVEHDKQDIG